MVVVCHESDSASDKKPARSNLPRGFRVRTARNLLSEAKGFYAIENRIKKSGNEAFESDREAIERIFFWKKEIIQPQLALKRNRFSKTGLVSPRRNSLRSDLLLQRHCREN